MAKPNDSCPLDIRTNGASFFGKTSDSLANVLEIPDDSIEENLVDYKLFERLVFQEPSNLVATLDDVEKI